MHIQSRTDAVVLNRRHFTWNRNSLSRKFRDCNNADEFVALFHALQEKVVATDGKFRDCNNADEFVALFHALQEKVVATDG